MDFCDAEFLHDDLKVTKSVSRPTCKNASRYDDYTLVEFLKRFIEYVSPVYNSVIIQEVRKLWMYKSYYEKK